MKSREELIELCLQFYEAKRLKLAKRFGIKPKLILLSSSEDRFHRIGDSENA